MSVDVRQEGGVAVVTLASPETRNALTPMLARDLVGVLDEVDADPGVGSLVLCAAPPAFCAGGDRQWLASLRANLVADSVAPELQTVYGLFERLERMAVPTVAALRGGVVGAGINLALACDVRLAAEDLRVVGFAGAGVHPGGGHLARFADRASAQAAAAVALLRDELDAQAAVRCGFAWAAVPTDEVDDRAAALAAGAGSDPELSRLTTATYRALVRPRVPVEAAVLAEWGPQVWSLRPGAGDVHR